MVAVDTWGDLMVESSFVEVLSDMVFGALDVGIDVGVLTDANFNVSAAVMTVLEFSMPASIP